MSTLRYADWGENKSNGKDALLSTIPTSYYANNCIIQSNIPLVMCKYKEIEEMDKSVMSCQKHIQQYLQNVMKTEVNYTYSEVSFCGYNFDNGNSLQMYDTLFNMERQQDITVVLHSIIKVATELQTACTLPTEEKLFRSDSIDLPVILERHTCMSLLLQWLQKPIKAIRHCTTDRRKGNKVSRSTKAIRSKMRRKAEEKRCAWSSSEEN